MPKMKCKCEEQIVFGNIPDENTYLYISDVKYDNYTGEVDSEKLFLDMNISVLCPKCKRLWIFKKGDNVPIEYLRIEDNE